MNLKAKPWNFKYLSCPREGQLLPVSGGALGKSLPPLLSGENGRASAVPLVGRLGQSEEMAEGRESLEK